MSRPQRSSGGQDISATSSRLGRDPNMASATASRRSELDSTSIAETISDYRDKINQLQLKLANYRSQEAKLIRDNKIKKKFVEKECELEAKKIEEHQEQDADALLEQEEKLSKLKGRYRVTDNPNEVVKIKKKITQVAKEETEVIKDIKKTADSVGNIYTDIATLLPRFYSELCKLKFYGDRQMNEILLRQINIYVEQVQERAKDYDKNKDDKFEENKALREKLKVKYTDHDQLK